jgi:hypothetical protein
MFAAVIARKKKMSDNLGMIEKGSEVAGLLVFWQGLRIARERRFSTYIDGTDNGNGIAPR